MFYNNFSLNLYTAIKLEELQKVNEASEKEVSIVREELHNVKKQYEQGKSMLSLLGLDPKQFSKSRRASNSTSKDMISDFNSTTRYRRRKETEKALQFIHHFIFQFSDDGAPETSQLTMSLGSMTLWNLGDRVRSRDYQYLLHCVSLSEKDQVLEDLWDQHTAEMALLEGNIIRVCGKQCTAEFQPSADMSWQSWANNEVNQAATQPSPYANVSKTNMTTMGGSIGFGDGDTWEPYTNAVREKHVKLVQQFTSSLPATPSEKAKHEKILKYLAENGLCQLGRPRIGIFAERQRPEPIHCEMNAWKQLLHLIYIEYVQRGKFDDFVNILGAPVVKCTSPATAAQQEVVWSTDDLLPFKQSSGNQAAMAGDDPQRKTETRLCEKKKRDWTWYAK